jgi:hypothetical protein
MSEQLSSLAYRLFVDTCRSPVTRMHYIKALRYFMEYLSIPLQDYSKLLPPEKDPKIIQMDICDFISHLRKKGLANATITLYLVATQKFYAMNDVTLNWKRIRSFMPDDETTVEDRPYTRLEIQTLLAKA